MTAAPVYQETIPIRASAFEGFPVKAAIDRGCSLTKVIFLPKDARVSDSDLTLPMRCLTFLNANFEDALRVMKEQAELPSSGKLHVTGVGCANYRDKIKEIIGLDVEFISEFLTIGRGAYLTLDNADTSDIFYPKPKLENVVEIPWHKMGIELASGGDAESKDDEDENGLFPAVAMYVGSGAGVMEILKGGITKFSGSTILSGRPFLGLANALLGTNNYDEIMELASKGDSVKTDLLVKDVMTDDPNSPYALFPSDLPIFPFGKASDDTWNLDECRREDVALSLVSLFASGVVSSIFPCVKMTQFKHVHLLGNFFRAEIVQRLILERMQLYNDGTPMEIKVVKTGHTGAIGAMLSNPDDAKTHIKWA